MFPTVYNFNQNLLILYPYIQISNCMYLEF